MSWLFVYGTLMRSYPENPFKNWLNKNAKYIGEGQIAGALYKVDYYPGLIDGDGQVKGEVYELLKEDETLPALDAYEDYLPHNPKDSLYIREKRKVTLAQTHDKLTCWVYIYHKSTENLDRYKDDMYIW